MFGQGAESVARLFVIARSGTLEPEKVAGGVLLACTQPANTRIIEIQMRTMAEPLAQRARRRPESAREKSYIIEMQRNPPEKREDTGIPRAGNRMRIVHSEKETIWPSEPLTAADREPSCTPSGIRKAGLWTSKPTSGPTEWILKENPKRRNARAAECLEFFIKPSSVMDSAIAHHPMGFRCAFIWAGLPGFALDPIEEIRIVRTGAAKKEIVWNRY